MPFEPKDPITIRKKPITRPFGYASNTIVQCADTMQYTRYITRNFICLQNLQY